MVVLKVRVTLFLGEYSQVSMIWHCVTKIITDGDDSGWKFGNYLRYSLLFPPSKMTSNKQIIVNTAIGVTIRGNRIHNL